MWDLDTIRVMNRPRREKQPVAKHSLEVLSRKLMSAAPPALPILIAIMRDSEEYGEFIDLIREYLPEYEGEILREAEPSSQMAAFWLKYSLITACLRGERCFLPALYLPLGRKDGGYHEDHRGGDNYGGTAGNIKHVREQQS